jgi:1-acyl-sn-glycerol-3-phosphate acyltransferase
MGDKRTIGVGIIGYRKREHARQGTETMGSEYSIAYPCRRVPRALVHLLGRLILPLAFSVDISGRENFPRGGPLLLVGNHTAAMEAVLMVVYTPWQIEMLGAADIPHERITRIAAGIYGLIPVNRGHFDRAALVKSLDVLKQGGVVAIFPEGGIWDAGRMRAHTGVAWLSYRANAPVLPIGFGGTTGALGAALRLKRPRLTMQVGQLMPAARLPEGKSRKAYLEAFATRVVEAIRALLPTDDPARRVSAIDERFELRVAVQAPDGSPGTCPDDLGIQHATALASLLHRPAILKIFTSNLNLPTRPLQNLEREPDPAEIVEAIRAILNYLDEENPYLLTYRFGPQQAEAMRLGLKELLALASWASESGLRLTITPIRRYTSPDQGEEIVQVRQGSFEGWM